jgi:Flp pilus assembly pilin Flp
MLLRAITRVQVWHAELRDRLEDQYGATAVEYALMLALIFMVVIGAVTFMGQQTNAQFEKYQLP